MPLPARALALVVALIIGSGGLSCSRSSPQSSTKQDAVWVYETAGRGVDGLLSTTPVFSRAMSSSQREAGDFFPAGGCDLVLVSEDRAVWRMPNQR